MNKNLVSLSLAILLVGLNGCYADSKNDGRKQENADEATKQNLKTKPDHKLLKIGLAAGGASVIGTAAMFLVGKKNDATFSENFKNNVDAVQENVQKPIFWYFNQHQDHPATMIATDTILITVIAALIDLSREDSWIRGKVSSSNGTEYPKASISHIVQKEAESKKTSDAKGVAETKEENNHFKELSKLGLFQQPLSSKQ
jgi:hypothetical protein